jgi:hypothetical protein
MLRTLISNSVHEDQQNHPNNTTYRAVVIVVVDNTLQPQDIVPDAIAELDR